jgi:hypothetical protein
MRVVLIGDRLGAWLGTPIYPNCTCVSTTWKAMSTARNLASAVTEYIYCVMLRICQFLFPFAMLAQIVTLDDDKTFQR